MTTCEDYYWWRFVKNFKDFDKKIEKFKKSITRSECRSIIITLSKKLGVNAKDLVDIKQIEFTKGYEKNLPKSMEELHGKQIQDSKICKQCGLPNDLCVCDVICLSVIFFSKKLSDLFSSVLMYLEKLPDDAEVNARDIHKKLGYRLSDIQKVIDLLIEKKENAK